MTWRLRLDVEDDREQAARPSKWRTRATIGSVIALASVWVVVIAVVAVWVAGVVVR